MAVISGKMKHLTKIKKKKKYEGRNTTHLGHGDEYDVAETFKMKHFNHTNRRILEHNFAIWNKK